MVLMYIHLLFNGHLMAIGWPRLETTKKGNVSIALELGAAVCKSTFPDTSTASTATRVPNANV